ncbi:MAG: Replication factor C small subunit, partial [Euryarchaeota archaeon CG_4_9_14_3_um_filter_38_12]
MDDVWIEKYRPKKLDEVTGQDDVVERLKAYVKTHSLPHLLFAGPAGTGKTTCALALAKEMFGEGWKQNFQEMNASDERGIQVVRTKIKDFARTA